MGRMELRVIRRRREGAGEGGGHTSLHAKSYRFTHSVVVFLFFLCIYLILSFFPSFFLFFLSLHFRQTKNQKETF